MRFEKILSYNFKIMSNGGCFPQHD
jgi:hypothetical protein